MGVKQKGPLTAGQSKSSGVLVTGGSGYIGTELVKKLSSQGDTVVSMYRHRLPEPQENVFPVCSDLSSEELLAAPLRGIDVVVHLAWDKTLGSCQSEQKPGDVSKSKKNGNLRLLRNLISAMEKARTKKLIFLSAIGADSASSETFLSEKYEAEFIILNSMIPEKVVLRAGIIYGGDHRRDRFLNSVRWLMRFPGLYLLPNAKSILYPLHVFDLVSLLANSVSLGFQDPVRLIEARGSEAVAVEDVFKRIMEVDGSGSRIAIGSFLGRILLPFFEKGLSKNKVGVKLSQYLRLGSKDQSSKDNLDPLGLKTSDFCSFNEGVVRAESIT